VPITFADSSIIDAEREGRALSPGRPAQDRTATGYARWVQGVGFDSGCICCIGRAQDHHPAYAMPFGGDAMPYSTVMKAHGRQTGNTSRSEETSDVVRSATTKRLTSWPDR
jgi:hypothetical protein